jgi:hypothetical protein
MWNTGIGLEFIAFSRLSQTSLLNIGIGLEFDALSRLSIFYLLAFLLSLICILD